MRHAANGPRDPIAIIGIGCRLPKADGPAALWELLRNGVDAIGELPTERFRIDQLYDPVRGKTGKVSSRSGGALDNIDRFDPAFFGISPREAELIDPQQRLLLEVAWEALEDGGQLTTSLAGSKTGVFVGMWINEYEAQTFRNPTHVDFYMTTGSGRYAASGRLSHFFGFEGPSLTVDTACSSSLVAIHLACRSLWSGESTLALAGGANVILEPQVSIAYSQSRMLAPDGRCKFGDERADGFVRSEGAAIVVLKPLALALADGDPVYATIIGSAVNNDGDSNGSLGTPSQRGQEHLLRDAYADAGVQPRDVDYVEAHGTGTSVGDPVEIGAIGAILGEGRDRSRPCLVGSVKTNVGHTEGAAGVAGLIKVALSMRHETVPPDLHFHNPTSRVAWDSLPLRIPTELTPWPENGRPRLAGVSAFGIAGTNAHVVLRSHAPAQKNASGPLPPPARYTLPLSARTPEALRATATAFHARLREVDEDEVSDICYSASVRRVHHDHRLAVTGRDRDGLREALESFAKQEPSPAIAAGVKRHRPGKVVFVFPGQGSQWRGMGRELLASEPVFRQTLEMCDREIAKLADFALIDTLTDDALAPRLSEIDVIQPALFSIQVGLAALWQSWGIIPDAVVGHSMGEVAAAYVAGILSIEDAARIICRRSRLLRRTSGQGAMAVVELSLSEAEGALADYRDKLSVAVANSARSTVLSGDPAALDELIRRLEAQNVFCRLVKVDVASHSPQMDPLRPDLLAALAGLSPKAGTVPLYSTVTAVHADGLQMGAEYWVRNLRQPVLFAKVVEHLLSEEHRTFIEMSAHPLLTTAIQEAMQERNIDGRVLSSLKREEDEQNALRASLASLYVDGHSIAWSALCSSERVVALPSYQWQRERYWYESPDPVRDAVHGPSLPGRFGHPLVGRPLTSAVHDGTYFWQFDLSTKLFPFLADHQVNGSSVLPASAYVDVALAAAAEIFGDHNSSLEGFAFERALVLSFDRSERVQIVVSTDSPGRASLKFLTERVEDASSTWTLHATCTIRRDHDEQSAPAWAPVDTVDLAFPAPADGSSDEHYRALRARSLEYGPSFRGLETIRVQRSQVVGRVSVPVVARESGAFRVHPALLDAAFQVLAAGLFARVVDGEENATYLPVAVGQIRLMAPVSVEDSYWCQAVWTETSDSPRSVTGDFRLVNDTGATVLEVRGFTLQRLAEDADQWARNSLYRIRWDVTPTPREAVRESGRGAWLILADAAGVGGKIARALRGVGDAVVVAVAGDKYRQIDNDTFELNPDSSSAFLNLFHDAFERQGRSCSAIVHMWSGDYPSSDGGEEVLQRALQMGTMSTLHVVQALAQSESSPKPRLWLVTQGVHKVSENDTNLSLMQSPIWGIGSVILSEHPELKCARVDLDRQPSDLNVSAFLKELRGDDHVEQVALRGDQRYVATLTRWSPEQSTVQNLTPQVAFSRGEIAYKAEVAKPGILDTLQFRVLDRQEPLAGEVEIEVCAAGLNLMNVFAALGIYPGGPGGLGPLGLECAGRVTRVGPGVTKCAVGDEVMAIAYHSLASHCVTDERLVILKPTALSFEEAATFPVVFLTAYYALECLGRMQPGERVLIHAAAGGVGLAAIQLAQFAGLEIYATAGTEAKRDFVRSLGVRHVMDSRSLSFGREVLDATGGEGVDLVLNSLAGEAIPTGLSVLKPYGRFLEIGKRDIYQNRQLGLLPFRKSLSYFAIDLDRMFQERPGFMGELFQKLADMLARGDIRPIRPLRIVPVSEAADAFREMAQGKHTGKLAIAIEGQSVPVVRHRANAETWSRGSYLITGGTGGLGLAVAEWMIVQGARSIALVGRNSPSEAAERAIEGFRQTGATILTLRGDVSDRSQVASILDEIDRTLPPLRGVVHAAGVLEDATLLQQTAARFQSVLAPKVWGAWNLHTLTERYQLDFFVLFSSVAALLGSMGQSNYAAGNAFLDALAHFRRARGLTALSINWGPWSQVGLAAARADRGTRLSSRGLGSITPSHGQAAMGVLMQQDVAQAAVMLFDDARWREFYPSAVHSSFLAGLGHDRVTPSSVGQSQSAVASIRQQLEALQFGRARLTMLETYLREQIAQVLKLSIDKVESDKAFRTMGLDSLMSLELRNRLEAGLGIALPASAVWNHPTVCQLAPHLATRMKLSLDESPSTHEIEAGVPPLDEAEARALEAALAEIEELSDGDARRLLENEGA